MNNHQDAAAEDPLELVVDLLKLARAVEPMAPREIDRRLNSLSGPKLDRPSWHLDRALRSADAHLRSLWNRLRRDSDSEPAWTDEWMPSCIHVERWALSAERREHCRLWTVGFLERLKDRLVPDARQTSEPGATEAAPTEVSDKEDLSELPTPKATAPSESSGPTEEDLPVEPQGSQSGSVEAPSSPSGSAPGTPQDQSSWQRMPDGSIRVTFAAQERVVPKGRRAELFALVAGAQGRDVGWCDALSEILQRQFPAGQVTLSGADRVGPVLTSPDTLRSYGNRIKKKDLYPFGSLWEQDGKGARWCGGPELDPQP